MKLTNNFSLSEMIKSQTAERKGINNNPNDKGWRFNYRLRIYEEIIKKGTETRFFINLSNYLSSEFH